MTNDLTGLSDALAETVSTSGAGVVRVEGRDRVPASGIIWSTDGICIRQIEPYVQAGIKYFFLIFPDPVSVESLQLFASEVMPHFATQS